MGLGGDQVPRLATRQPQKAPTAATSPRPISRPSRAAGPRVDGESGLVPKAATDAGLA
jgi:hypothetical protein